MESSFRMARKWRSRIFHEPSPDGRTRDLFPLPTLKEEQAVRGGVCRAVARRVQRRGHIIKRVNMAITSLNSLFFGKSGITGGEVSNISSLPLCQRLCIKDLLSAVEAFGAKPANASHSGALQALRVPGGSYELEAGVGEVTDMILERLSLPSGLVAGVNLEDALGEPLKQMVVNFEDWMLQDANTWGSLAEVASLVKPYDDPSLSSHTQYLKFLRHLHTCGILGTSNTCRGRVGAFCVTKKSKVVNGEVQHRQRLILDCRQVNMAFREPPRSELGSLSALCELELSENEVLYCGGSDIQDCFYAARISERLSDFFCLTHDITYTEALNIFGDQHVCVGSSGLVSPCITVLPMGFSWSFYLIQKLHEQSALRALGTCRDDLVLEGYPAPSLVGGKSLAMPYCDNVHCLSTSRQECNAGMELMCKDLQNMGFSLHEDCAANDFFQTLGGVVDGKEGKVKPTPTRAWNILLAFESLLSGKVDWVSLRKLLGHAMTICTLCRPGMSIFRALYDFVEKAPPPRPLHKKERREVEIFVGLLPLLYGDLRRPWSEKVFCSDASPEGFGVCQTELPVEQVQSIGRWQEKWRFRHLDPSEWRPRQRASGLDVIRDVESVRAGCYEETPEDLYSYNGNFPEVPQDILQPERWSTQLMGKWGNTATHITAKEGDALVLVARHIVRSSASRGKRHLVLVDSFSISMMSCKGRASNFGLLRTAQKLAALSLGGNLSIRTRWIRSEDNVSDGPSRGQISPGPLLKSGDHGGGSANDMSCAEAGGECTQLFAHGPRGEASHSSLPQHHEREHETSESQGEEPFTKCSSKCKASEAEDHSQDGWSDGSCMQVGEESWFDVSGEKVGVTGRGIPIRRVLSEIHEFLPGSRIRAPAFRENRRPSSRIYGWAISGGQRGGRRREDTCKFGISSRCPQRKFDQRPQMSQRVEKGMSTSKSYSLTKVCGIRGSDDHEVSQSCRDGSQSAFRFRRLPSASRGNVTEGQECGSTGQGGRATVQLACNHHPRVRRWPARQGGGFRQFNPVEYTREDLVGTSTSKDCQEAGGQEFTSVFIHGRGVQKRVLQGSSEVGVGAGTPVPTASWRSSRRHQRQSQRPCGSEATWPLVYRPVSEKVHKNWKSPELVEPVVARRSGVLSMVTPQHGESVSGQDASKEFLRRKCSDNVLQCGSLPHTFALEVFAGTGRIVSSLHAIGIPAFPIDICIYPDHDVLHATVEHRIFNWIRKKRIPFVWCGMPCTTFSRARKFDGLGPGPLRSSQYLWGMPYLNWKDQQKVHNGNSLLMFTIRLLRLCEQHCTPYVLENPDSSMAWEMDVLQQFCSEYSPSCITLDYCQFGEAWKKPTRLIYNYISLRDLQKRCNTINGRCSFSQRQHVPLTGLDASGNFMTLRAQPYPWAMAEQVASQVAKAISTR